MHLSDIGVLALRGLAGGTLVVVFALISEAVSPKAFSGLFSAAPSVAVASLAITVVAETPAKARQASIGIGAVLGGAGLVVFAMIGEAAFGYIPSFLALPAALLGWLIASCALYATLAFIRPVTCDRRED
jgi:Protein of unknown function (DUF3147)